MREIFNWDRRGDRNKYSLMHISSSPRFCLSTFSVYEMDISSTAESKYNAPRRTVAVTTPDMKLSAFSIRRKISEIFLEQFQYSSNESRI